MLGIHSFFFPKDLNSHTDKRDKALEADVCASFQDPKMLHFRESKLKKIHLAAKENQGAHLSLISL